MAAKGNGDAKQNIRVFVRVRPTLPLESTSRSILECTSKSEVTLKECQKGKLSDRITKKFRFNNVFNPQATQAEVYEHVVEPLLEEVLQGYSCTVFAYGQTGTGKTYTMEGGKSKDENRLLSDTAGIIPRTLSDLFDRLRLMDATYAVRISFLELYNEELIDLLSAPEDATKLRIFEDSSKKGAVIISGLEEVDVSSKADVYNILEKGSMKRQTASTLMNATSSRSHTVFTATLYIRTKSETADEQDVLRTGKINLVDLAGSENIGRSGAIEMRAREAGNINQSLLTLGRVITALVDNSSHIPYRESKLTRLLQESLGGRTKTSIIATVSPALSNFEETLSTLEYAHRAKNIQNKPEVNQRLTKKLHLAEYTKEIERLHRDLEASKQHSGVFLHQSEYDEMLARTEALAEENVEKAEQIKLLIAGKLKHEALCNELSEKLQLVEADLRQNEAALAEKKTEQHKLQTEIEGTRETTQEEEVYLRRLWEHNEALKAEAVALLSEAAASLKRMSSLGDKLQRVRTVTGRNEKHAVDMEKHVCASIDSGLKLVETAAKENTGDISAITTDLHSGRDAQSARVGVLKDDVRSSVEVEQEMIQAYRRSEAENDERDAAWTAKLEDAAQAGRLSSDALHNWQTEHFRPVLNKQRSQLQEVGLGINDMHSLAVDVDTWREEFRTEMLKETEHTMKAMLGGKVTPMMHDLIEFETAKANTAELKDKHSNYIKNMRKELSNMKEAAEAMRSGTKDWRETSEAKRADMANSVAKYSAVAAAHSRDVDAISSERNADLLLTKDRFSERITKGCNEICNAVNQWDTTDSSGDVVPRFRDAHESSRAAWLSHKDASLSLIDEGRERESANSNIRNKKFEEFERLPEDCASKNSGGLDNLISNTLDWTRCLQSRTSEYADKGKTWTESAKKTVAESNERIHTFFEQDYKEDVPTGDTPQRENNNFPRVLPRASPREQVIARHRQNLLRSRMAFEEDSAVSQEDCSGPVLSAVAVSSGGTQRVSDKENSDFVRESPKMAEKKTKVRKPLQSQRAINQ